MKNLIIILSLLFINNAYSGEISVLKLTHTVSESIRTYNIITDNNGDFHHLKKTKYKNGETIQSTLSFEQLTKNDFELSSTAQKFVNIRFTNLYAEHGGHLTINYAYNILTGAKRTIEFDLIRNGDKWSIFDKNNKLIKHVHLIINKKIMIPVGVKEFILN